MINYYEELKLDKSRSASELADDLIRLESVWTDRAATRPEKSMEMLTLIAQAKKVFASEASKADYERRLFAPPKPDEAADPDAARRAEFEKWSKTAEDYYSRGELDMAKTALGRAMPNADENDFAFMNLAAQIYNENDEPSVALDYINKAILLAPELAELYLTKADVLQSLYIEERQHRYGNPQLHFRQMKDMLRMASQKAKAQGDKPTQSRADGILAYTCYFNDAGSGEDKALGERLAIEAVKSGDASGLGQRVLDDLAKKRDAADRAAKLEQERRAELERKERERQAAAERAEQERLEAERLAELKKKKAAAAKRRRRIIALSLALSLVLILILAGGFSMRRKLVLVGDHVNYSFDSASGELRISGRGETWDFPLTGIFGHGGIRAPWDEHRFFGVTNTVEPILDIIAKRPDFTQNDVQSLVIEDGITYIGKNLFQYFGSITDVTIPESVKGIQSWAFESCGNAVIHLPGSIEYVSSSAFSGCKAVEYDGTLEDWLRLCGDYYNVFDSGVLTVQCSNGHIERPEVYGEIDVYYDGTCQDMQELLASLSTEVESTVTIHCSDGNIVLNSEY